MKKNVYGAQPKTGGEIIFQDSVAHILPLQQLDLLKRFCFLKKFQTYSPKLMVKNGDLTMLQSVKE